MKLGRKFGNRSSIRSEELFLEITMILGEKREIRDQAIFFLETLSFENPCLGPLTLNIHHCLSGAIGAACFDGECFLSYNNNGNIKL